MTLKKKFQGSNFIIKSVASGLLINSSVQELHCIAKYWFFNTSQYFFFLKITVTFSLVQCDSSHLWGKKTQAIRIPVVKAALIPVILSHACVFYFSSFYVSGSGNLQLQICTVICNSSSTAVLHSLASNNYVLSQTELKHTTFSKIFILSLHQKPIQSPTQHIAPSLHKYTAIFTSQKTYKNQPQ